MSKLFKLPIEEYLVRVRVSLETALRNLEILAALEIVDYGEVKIAAGLDLLDQADLLFEVQKTAYNQRYTATETLYQARTAADERYEKNRDLALLVFKRDSDRQRQLGIDQPKERSFSGWLRQVQRFYDNALAAPEIVEALSRYNLTQADLESGLALVQDAGQRYQLREEKKAAAQQATKDRDAACTALDVWFGDFAGFAEYALADKPQLVEALQLGIVR